MRLVIQRVSHASVQVNAATVGSIGQGLLVLAGIEHSDTPDDIQWLSGKLVHMRIFNDEAGVMNKSVLDMAGEILLISQFTLHASTRKGNRPSYIQAAPPAIAIPLYQQLIEQIQTDLGKAIATGVFGANMQVTLLNDGPVTIIIDSKNKT